MIAEDVISNDDPKSSGLGTGKEHKKIRELILNLVNMKDESGQLLYKLQDGGVIDTKSWDTDTWDWTHGIGLYGLWAYYELTKDPLILSFVSSWFDKRFASGVVVEKNINTMSPFLTLARLFEKTGQESYLPHLTEWAKWAFDDLRRTKYGAMQHDTHEGANSQQIWDDTLMMTVLPLARIGVLLKQPLYLEEAKHQFLVHIKYLFDPTTGAFFHGWTFDGHHHFARARWARGNCWLTIAIPEFVHLLDHVSAEHGGWKRSDSLRRHLLDTLDAQLEFLIACQHRETGMWHTLLDHDDAGSYLEASATAGFAYGIMRAQKLGYLEERVEVQDVVELAVEAVMSRVSDEGELRDVSFGTGMGSTLDFYRRIPRTSMPYGQAMAIMALTEYLQR